MSKGKYAKKKAPFVDIYGVLLLIATLAMSIAYAEIVGTEITISTKAEATAQEGVFITDVICNESNSVSNNYMATTLDSSITLDSPTDTKNFTITIYNKTLKPYVFVGVKKLDKWDEFTGVYNNTNISYTLGNNMVPHETILPAKEWITFNVDLGFNGEGTMPETLRSLLNFSFQEIPTLEIVSEDTIENIYPNCEEKVYEFTVSNQRQDEEHGLITNGVPLTYTIAPNVPAPLTAKIYDKDGVEVASNKAITISSEAKEEQTYTMKVKWDNTNSVDGTPYNSASYAGQTLASSINAIATPNLVDGYDKYVGYTLDKAEPAEIKTAPLYFDVSTDKTTVEMNNDSNNAEKIILTVKNNNGTNTNIFETEYKISIDNSKFTLLVDGVELGENTIKLAGSSATTQTKELQLISKEQNGLEQNELCNISISAVSPYSLVATIPVTIKDSTGPTAPVIEGGSTGTYATSQTISVSEVSTDVGTGVGKYQYLLNDTESTETESIEVADVTTTATSQTFTEDAPGYYVYFRAVDNAGNPGEWSNAQQIYIDTAEPTVSLADGVSSEITIEEGDSNEVASYFKHDKNGNAGIKSVTYTVNGTPIENTDELTASDTPYTIICTVTKDTNVSKTASITIIVEAGVTIATDGSWNGKVNNPLLMSGMTAVYWSTDGGVTASTTEEGATPIYSKIGGVSTGADNPNFVWKNWYKYVSGDNATDTKTSRWANAVTDDGSYWVWVPRYKYLISEQPTTAGNTNAGKIDIKFIPTTDKKGTSGYTTTANSEGEILTKDSNGYIIHPAFENGSSSGKNNGYANGEWDKDLPGFWVAKYEMSMEDANGANVNTSDSSIGNVKIGNTAKMVSKPGVQSWRNIQVGQMYQNCLLYDEAKGSHMIKNSEWGATAYLTHSQYGRNRNEITINDSEGYYTGNAGASPTDSSTQSTIGNAYNTTAGMLASTTGNIYGVYDMSGGAWEYVAGWDTKSTSSYITDYGKAVDGTVYFTSGGSSNKYKTAYSNGTSKYSGSKVKTVCRTGDGIKETWISSYFSWFNDFSFFVGSSGPFSLRSGLYNYVANAGVFFSNYNGGSANIGGSFRAVLSKSIVEVEQVSETLEITEGTENTFASLFTVTTADGGTASVTYTLNGASASADSNTSDLAVGTHTITCTATYNGMSDSATTTVIVESARPKSITTATSIQSATTPFIDGTGKNTIIVPGGFKVRTDLATTVDKGIVIEDSSGNQFVWIPIGEVTRSDGKVVNIEFGRYSDFSSTANPKQYASGNRWNAEVSVNDYYLELTTYRQSTYASSYDNGENATAKDLKTFISNSIENGGYYIARYEASFRSGDVINSVTAYQPAITNQKPSFIQSSSYSEDTTTTIATVTAKPGMLWNCIRQGDASLACQNLYAGNEYNNKDFVECDLVNSYAWDTAIMFIQKCSDKTDYAYQSDGKGALNNTGKTQDIICNIYDMAGNLYEWSTEYYSGTKSSFDPDGAIMVYTYPVVLRGATARSSSSDTASYRGYTYGNDGGNLVGFRAVLTIL